MKSKKHLILQKATDIASQVGFEALSIGHLADQVGMSKSGLFAHFKSKANLQIEALGLVESRFQVEVMSAVVAEPRGVARLMRMAICWYEWTQSAYLGGCPMLSGLMEYDDQPGPVRDKLKSMMIQMFHSIELMACQAQEEGELSVDLDVSQFRFEFVSLMLGAHVGLRMMQEQRTQKQFVDGIIMLIDRYRNSG